MLRWGDGSIGSNVAGINSNGEEHSEEGGDDEDEEDEVDDEDGYAGAHAAGRVGSFGGGEVVVAWWSFVSRCSSTINVPVDAAATHPQHGRP